jgi:methylmalonyl-CoA/ethylmalonyl-CoA epimerase
VGVGKLNHVAIAVPDLEQATSLYRDVMGAKVSDPLVRPPHTLILGASLPGANVVFAHVPPVSRWLSTA